MGPAPPRFFPALETLRGVAALIVALWHVSWQNHFTSLTFLRNGWLMVDLFFVLSGFVMFHSYGEKLRTAGDAKRFLVVRWGRLYPLHFVMLLVFVAIECAKWGAMHFHVATVASAPFAVNTPGSLIANLLLAHALGFCPGPTWNVPSWSISTEFYVYALFAVAALVVGNRRWFVTLCAALSAAGLALTWITAGNLNSSGRFAFFRCMLGFFAGVVTRSLYGSLRVRPLPAGFVRWSPLVVLAAVVVMLSIHDLEAGTFLFVPLFMALVLTAALANDAGTPLLTSRPLVWLGTVSYSIYMVHSAIVWAMEFVFQYVLRLPRLNGYIYLTGAWTGDVLLVFYVTIVLLVSRWTFRHIEDRYRRMVKAAAFKSLPAA